MWELVCTSSNTVVPAKVPGTVYGTLLENGYMEDPFLGDKENRAMERMQEDYVYQCQFDVSEDVWQAPVKELVLEGVDTVADVYLNDVKIAHTENMHRTWRLDVTGCLARTSNRLRVYLHGPIPFIREAYAKCRTDGSEEAMVGFPLLRKAHYMFGWDWGPHLPDAGIFRSVTLQGIEKARIEQVSIVQEHAEQSVTLHIHVEEKKYAVTESSYQVVLTTPEGEVTTYEGSPTSIPVEHPLLWWPNGYGEQYLYHLTVIQMAEGVETDRYSTRIGLRRMTLHREKDQWGESFAHCVNGVDVFAMGADYIPEDNLLGRLNRERTRTLLQHCKDCNFNTIRVWGGGFFPDDWFYEICDEMGFLVWQDLMFACAVYELDDAFEENISAEIRDNLRRIGNHPCLALICGNNEMEMFVNGNLWVTKPKQKADYTKMYEYLFPKLVKKYAPGIEYWPASPSSGGAFDEPNDFNRGDVHYWDVWHNDVPFTEYRKYHFRYLSEFGFQALPSIRTIETFIEKEEDLNLFSYVMEKHQRNKSANAKIMQYMQQTFRYPTDFETLIYASQMLQGEAIKYGVEHFRRNRGRCMGAVYWQLNDCWPVISWASIDSCGRWKALQYYAKRFFAPVLLSCEETGMLSEHININGENETFVPAVRFNVSNETREQKHLRVEWELRNAKGEVLKEGCETLDAAPLKAVWMEKIEFQGVDIFEQYVTYRLLEKGEVLSESSVIFSVPKYFHYADPKLRVYREGEFIMVESKAYAKGVEIQNSNEDLILSDNYFDMNPGIRAVRILRGMPEGLKVRSVYDIH